MLPMLVPMLTSVIGGLCADAATNLAKEHVMEMVEKAIPPQAMRAIDAIVDADPMNPCKTMGELIDCMVDPDNVDVPALPEMPAVPEVHKADTKAMIDAVEGLAGQYHQCFVLSLDPATMDVKIDKV